MRSCFKTNLKEIKPMCDAMNNAVGKVFAEFHRAYIGNGNYYYLEGSDIEVKVRYEPVGCTVDVYCKTNSTNYDEISFSMLESAIVSTFEKECSKYKIERVSVPEGNYAEKYNSVPETNKAERDYILNMCRREVVIVKRSEDSYNILFISSDQESGKVFHLVPLAMAFSPFPCGYTIEGVKKEGKALFKLKSAKLFDASTSGKDSIEFSELKEKIFANEYSEILEF